MPERFVICDHGEIEASLVPHKFLDRPGMCPAGVYETLLLKNGDPADWKAHWDRLLKSCQYINVPVERLRSQVTREAVAELVAKQGLTMNQARLRIEIFSDEHQLESGKQISFLAAIWPVLSKGNAPVTAAIGRTRRQHNDPRYNHKMLGRRYIDEELDTAAVRHLGDVIFLNNRGELCEGSYSNICLIEPGKLITPPLSAPCLPGITRANVIAAAKEEGLTVEDESPVTLEAVRSAVGMFLTSTVRGLQPVSAIEDFLYFPETVEAENVITQLTNRLRT